MTFNKKYVETHTAFLHLNGNKISRVKSKLKNFLQTMAMDGKEGQGRRS
jgi:hypothetical protein